MNKGPAAHSDAIIPPAGGIPRKEDSSGLVNKNQPAALNNRWIIPGICFLLAAAIWLVFGQTLGHDFVYYDDNEYVYENPEVVRGLTLRGIVWAFTGVHSANWHPLTWISHMLDCQFYGLDPGGHHLTNVLLHMAAAILLFLVLRLMTGALWRSAFVAMVFAIHPLRAESVAWVAERKDVLSGVFFMLTLWAWAGYARGTVEREADGKTSNLRHRPGNARRYYWLAIFFFALGLMSKPMLVTLPFVLLLLDYWPLGRATAGEGGLRVGVPIPQRLMLKGLLYEKLPMFGLAAASCAATIFAQTKAIQTFQQMPLSWRAGNALISYAAYLGQMFWPSGLAVLYPLTPGGVGVARIGVSLIVLAGVSAGVFVLRRRCPYLLTGWLWYLIMLVPVIGIVQVGAQSRADRYTYLPQIGLYLLLTWAVADFCAGWRHRRMALGGGATIILVALILCARHQVAYWRNSLLLWDHTLACTPDNDIAHFNLGSALLQKGAVDQAIVQFQKALEITPDYAEARNNFGNALLQKGSVNEAMVQFQKALEIAPDSAEAHCNLGNALLQKGDADQATVQFERALAIKPDDAKVRNNLGNVLLQKGRINEAIAQFQKALEIRPDSVESHYNLGNALLQSGDVDGAIVQFERVLAVKSDDAETHNNLGNALLRKGRVNEAVAHFQQAGQFKPDSAEIQNNLGTALNLQGQVDEAVVCFQKALEIKPGYAEARYNLGMALARTHGDHANKLAAMGRDDEAMIEFKKALEICPDYADARHDLAILLLQRGQVDEAIAQFQMIQKQYPNEAMASFDLGNAYFQKGRMDEAVAAYQRALKIKPDDVSARNNLGMALFREGMVDAAVEQFCQVLALQPDFALARTNLNKALLQKEHPDRQ